MNSSTNKQATQTFGQPTPKTHPHLLQENELVPGIMAEEFVQRRQNVMENIQKYALSVDKHSLNHLVNKSKII